MHSKGGRSIPLPVLPTEDVARFNIPDTPLGRRTKTDPQARRKVDGGGSLSGRLDTTDRSFRPREAWPRALELAVTFRQRCVHSQEGYGEGCNAIRHGFQVDPR